MKAADSPEKLKKKLSAGTWVSLCRQNAERLAKDLDYEVQYKTFMRQWSPMDLAYTYKARTQFRARLKQSD